MARSQFQRRQYETVARILGEARQGEHPDAWDQAVIALEYRFRQVFGADNPRFDASRFTARIGQYARQGQTDPEGEWAYEV